MLDSGTERFWALTFVCLIPPSFYILRHLKNFHTSNEIDSTFHINIYHIFWATFGFVINAIGRKFVDQKLQNFFSKTIDPAFHDTEEKRMKRALTHTKWVCDLIYYTASTVKFPLIPARRVLSLQRFPFPSF